MTLQDPCVICGRSPIHGSPCEPRGMITHAAPHTVAQPFPKLPHERATSVSSFNTILGGNHAKVYRNHRQQDRQRYMQ
jgi:hypothetical protein